jgi:L-cysteine/cystine lyase
MRDQLPAVHDTVHMNTGTSGPVPQAAIDAMQRSVQQNAEPRITRTYFESLLGGRDEARAAAGRAVGAPPDQIALTTSTTLGVGLVMSGLDWRDGDEILTTTEEHPGILSPLEVLRQRHGVVPRFVDADEVAGAVTDRTKMVAVSHVLWTTGRTLDLPPIADAVHAVGGLLLIDGAQSAGNIAVDVAATGADAYAFSGQKWLLGPLGSGGLWVTPELTQRVWPVTSGYFSLEGGEIGKFKASAGRLDGGTNDPATLAGFRASLEWVEGLPGGRARWIEQIAANAAAARERLAEVPGLSLGLDSGNGLIAFTLDGHEDTAGLAALLAERGVLVRFIPNTPWMRASIGAWTTPDDVEALAAALPG